MSVPRKRARKTFSCSFCRLKKKKCDQQKPACSYCIRHDNGHQCDYSTKTYSYGMTADKTFGIIGSVTTPQQRFDPFIEYDISKIVTSTSKDQGEASREYLQQKIGEYQAKLRALEISEMIRKTGCNPHINEQDVIELFPDNVVSLLLRTNCVLDVKPLNTYHIVGRDPYVRAVFRFKNSAYRNLKAKMKLEKLDANVNLLIHSLPTALNEDFRSHNFQILFDKTINKNNPHHRYNLSLLASVYTSKRSRMSFLSYNTTSEDVRATSIREVERLLPRLEVVLYLWDNFERYVYPFVPVLDLRSFKRDLELIIIGLKFQPEDSQALKNCTYKVSVTTFIDLSVISAFLVILRISYLSLKLNPDLVLTGDPIEAEILSVANLGFIGPEYIDVASICLSQVKALQKSSINVLGAILYFYYYRRTCEESSNSILGSERHILFGNIHAQAASIGLYRDWESIGMGYITHNYSGLCIGKDNLAYMARRFWHLIRRFGAEESMASGFLHAAHRSNVKLPATKVREDWIHPPDISSLLIDQAYLMFDDSNCLIEDIVAHIYQDRAIPMRQFYGYVVKLDNMMKHHFGSDIVAYFNTDLNFWFHKASKESPETQLYYLVLSKALNFEKYLVLQLAQLKLSLIILFHYELLNNLPNFIYFFKQVASTVVSVLKVIHETFISHNQDFLKLHRNRSFKSFNHKLYPLVNDIGALVSVFLMGISYRLFFTVSNLAKRVSCLKKQNNPHVLLETSLKLERFIHFKNLILKIYDYALVSQYEKTCKFYNHVVRYHVAFRDVLVKLQEQNSACEQGKPFHLIAFSADTLTDNNIGQAYGLDGHEQKPPTEQIFVKLNDQTVEDFINIFITLAPQECLPICKTNVHTPPSFVVGNIDILSPADSSINGDSSDNNGISDTTAWLDRRLHEMKSNHLYTTFLDGYLFTKIDDLMDN